MQPDGYHKFGNSTGYPNLQLNDLGHCNPRPTSAWHPWHRARPKVVALHLEPNGSFGSATEYSDPTILQDHFDKHKDIGATPRRSVYILEALRRNLATVFQAHFQLQPAVFEDHDRLIALDNRATGEGGGIPFLPSAIRSRDYISFKYHEPIVLSPLPTGFRNLCDVSGRHIAVTRFMGEFSEVAVARRKCTFWSRKTEGGGWDCKSDANTLYKTGFADSVGLIVCDPPVQRVLTEYSGRTGYNVTTSPYNAGYIDFVPQKDQIESGSGPPRTSLLDDVVFYIKTHSNALDLTDPDSLRTFVEKITASHYLKLARFIQTVIEKVQFNLSRRQDLTSFAIAAVEEQWSDVQALERRIGEYKDDLEAIMLQSRIPFESPNLKHAVDWKDRAADYQFLYMRFKEIGQRANSLNGSTAALAGLTNNRHAVKAQDLVLEATERSIREAKSAKALTMLGVVFIPLAYVSSLFSMSDPYRPGEKLFWVYFVVALPLIVLTIFGYYTLELGYTSGRIQWSFRTAFNTVREKSN